ncbi:hypothetical protein Plec18167_007321 [Paecilomyces lecythidis]|uniref:Up-regulated during septation protein 1 domain-containing protein n=1 Tax=Paecilomyces lecythidis TaxID=3004212 RepID=A0ABR3X511_9EURO
MINFASLRSSQSSYGDSRYISSASFPIPPPPSKALLDGYRDSLDPNNEEKPRFNPLNASHPRSSALLDVTDPVSMHLLTETAMGDSMGYEVLSFEEVEELKKEYSLLSTRVEATKRKLALETKLRDAARSLSRLHSPKSSRTSEDYGSDPSPGSHRKRRSIFGRNGDDNYDKADEELATSTRKCEDLAQELWRLERRTQDIQRRLLEHTAGILQMTHKGLKKNLNKNGANSSRDSRNGESVYGVNGGPDFDDRSLYRPADYLDESNGGYSRSGHQSMAVDLSVIQNTERKLEELSGRMRAMILQNSTDSDVEPVPQLSSNGGPVNPTAAVEAHIAYIENSLQKMSYQQDRGMGGSGAAGGSDPVTQQELEEINNRLHAVLGVSGAGSARSPTIPPPPQSSGEDNLQGHLRYLSEGVDTLQRRVEGLVEQKSILTTQIQQQRELNSKSDAERDSHIADLTQQLMEVRRDLEQSETNHQSSRDELASVVEQLDAARRDLSLRDQERGKSDNDAVEIERQARIQAEEQVSHLEGVLQQIRDEADGQIKQANDLRSQAEENSSRLEAALQQLREEADAEVKEATEARSQAEERANKLEGEMRDLETDIVRAQTELTVVKAELDGAYGTRAERAAAVAANPAIQKEIDELNLRNINLSEELAALKAEQSSKHAAGNSDLQQRVQTLEKELRETIDDYEAMTKASIEFEKERDKLESVIDNLRERCENLESQLNDERIKWMGIKSPIPVTPNGPVETTSTMVLKNEFKKMMRDTRAENLKLLKAEQEERRKLEALIRTLRKDQMNGQGVPAL